MHFSISLSAQFVRSFVDSLAFLVASLHVAVAVVVAAVVAHSLAMQNVPLGECLLRSCYSIQKRPPRSTVGGVDNSGTGRQWACKTMMGVSGSSWRGRSKWKAGVTATDFVRSYVIFISAKEIGQKKSAEQRTAFDWSCVPSSRSIAQ